ncbi:MAG: hypothetical protein J0J01_12500 [Reyranella sp.]|uniref:hypothetical protein n=1 Tax=Reyranella sp. TaxID=1929291 RepID=UPI001AD5577A|nr:hypothetical protein [Reyranella sp.]MBN9087721.1 hypothetical protein [Reyranella sp.]
MKVMRKLWPPLAALAVTVVSLLVLPFAAALAVMAMVCLVSIVRLKSALGRNAALIVAAFLFGLAGIEFGLYLLEPTGQEIGAVRTQTPPDWYPYDPVLQYKLKPNITVKARATWGDQRLYDVTYTIDAQGARVTPGSVDQAPTYIVMGDSYAFSEGVNDNETAASLFAQRLKPAAHVVNFGVPGWGATHQVRALETGLFDKAVVGKVAAVIVWVTPPHLERVTGDASWLGNAPRYDFGSDGKLHYSGTFTEYRWSHPWAGLGYLARTHFRFVRRLTNEAMEREQAKLYVALTARLKELVWERYGASLILLSNGPEPSPPASPDQPDLQYLPAFDGLRAIGAPVISVRNLLGPPSTWGAYFIPHDGHPTPRMNGMVADALVKYFQTQ